MPTDGLPTLFLNQRPRWASQGPLPGRVAEVERGPRMATAVIQADDVKMGGFLLFGPADAVFPLVGTHGRLEWREEASGRGRVVFVPD
jgi:hypothetical protein